MNINKQALLEWLQSQIKEAITDIDKAKDYNDGIMGVCSILKSEIQSGAFDSPSDDRLRADEQGYREWVLGGLKNATTEIQRLRSAFSARGVFNALRYYQKQGICEGNEYEEIENALEILSAKTSTVEQRSMEPVGKMKIFNRDGSVTEVTPNRLWTPEGEDKA